MEAGAGAARSVCVLGDDRGRVFLCDSEKFEAKTRAAASARDLLRVLSGRDRLCVCVSRARWCVRAQATASVRARDVGHRASDLCRLVRAVLGRFIQLWRVPFEVARARLAFFLWLIQTHSSRLGLETRPWRVRRLLLAAAVPEQAAGTFVVAAVGDDAASVDDAPAFVVRAWEVSQSGVVVGAQGSPRCRRLACLVRVSRGKSLSLSLSLSRAARCK